MNLQIKNYEVSRCSSVKKTYGQLTIDTTMKENRKILNLNEKHNSNLDNKKNINKQYNKCINSDKINPVNINDSIEIIKGQKMAITSNLKEGSDIIVALDWKEDLNLELDTSVFMVDENNKTNEKDFIFYGNRFSRNSSVEIINNNLELGEFYNNLINVRLQLIPDYIKKIAVTITIYDGDKKGQTFQSVYDGYFRIIDKASKKEIVKYNFTKGLNNETAIVVAEIYRYKSEWKISPVGNGFIGGLKVLCDNYGIKTK